MFKTAESSLQKKALHAVIVLPEEKLPILIQFADFLKNESYNADIPDFSEKNTAEKRSSISGCLKGKIQIAEDFNETPDCFGDYV
ncbi:MAG: DUF2281 domain-containing protein [Anaerolineaceae bacterium]|nr:DUF2281 domain-containing protein [Anaerolineaceae bacterium]